MNDTEQSKPDASMTADLRATLHWVRAQLWLIIIWVLVAGIAGILYAFLGPKTYRAQAVIEVEQGEQKVFKTEGDANAQDFKGEEIAKTVEQSLTSPELLLGLIEHNHLKNDPAFLPGLKRPASDGKIVEELAKHISVQVRRGTRLIDIAVDDRNPVMAQKLADFLVGEFVHENLRRHMEVSQMVYDFLLQQAERLKAKLAKSEQALQAYKEQNQGVALEEKQNIVVAKLDELNRLVTEAKAARIKLEADYNQVRKLRNSAPADLLGVPSIANAPNIIELQKSIATNEAQVATLKKMYGERHPNYIAVENQLQELHATLKQAILNAADVTTNAYLAAVATETQLEDSLREQEKLALELNKISIPYGVLTREAETDRALYESVLTRLKEINVTKDIAQDGIQMVSHPLLPEKPVWPDKKRVLLLSVFGGLALGCGVSLASRVLDSSFMTAEQAERRLGIPALGVIPRCARLNALADYPLLVKQPASATAEAFRTVRTSLALLNKKAGYKTFLFTSATNSEGKSFCAINCAVAFAQRGLKTLLIDADRQSPSIDGIFFGGTPIEGLTDTVARQTDLDRATLPTGIDNLSLLCTGSLRHTLAELLASDGLGRLLMKEAVQKFDRVVVDSSPVETVSDTLLVAANVQATCLVISAQTPAETVSQTVRRLSMAGATLAGFIFNHTPRRRGAGYSYRFFKAAIASAKASLRKGASKPPPKSPRPMLQDL